jgi:hypothetical protein
MAPSAFKHKILNTNTEGEGKGEGSDEGRVIVQRKIPEFDAFHVSIL